MTGPEQPSRATAASWVVRGILVLEALASVALLVTTVVGFIARGDDPLLPALSIVIVAAIACLWVVATAIGMIRGRSWARGSTLTIQILLFTVGVGAFQGLFAQPAYGWALTLPAVIGFIAAVLSKPSTPPTPSAES